MPFGRVVALDDVSIDLATEMWTVAHRVERSGYTLVDVRTAVAGIILTGQTASGQTQAAINYELPEGRSLSVGPRWS